MNKLEKVNQLISYLLEASPEYLPYCEQHPKNYTHQRVLIRGLMNIRNPEKRLTPAFYELQNDFLSMEDQGKGIISAIHSTAGIQLPEECAQIMKIQGYEEPTGQFHPSSSIQKVIFNVFKDIDIMEYQRLLY